ncbi:hypothetical protein N8920_01205 [Opitutales bacterium]|nr:hypothetical protein [Opitutales bacterium]
MIDLRCDRDSLAHIHEGYPWLPTANSIHWVPISSNGINQPETELIRKTVYNHQSALLDLTESVQNSHSPECGLKESMAKVRFVRSVFASHLVN